MQKLKQWLNDSVPNIIATLASAIIVAAVANVLPAFSLGVWPILYGSILLVWAVCLLTVALQFPNAAGRRKSPFLRAAQYLVFVLPLGVVVLYAVQTAREYVDPSSVKILVTEIDGPAPESYRVTDIILAELNTAFKPYPDVQVEAAAATLSEAEGEKAARRLGAEAGASMVLWGWYGVTDQAVKATLHVELMDGASQRLPRFCRSSQYEASSVQISEFENFTLQADLATGFKSFALLVAGVLNQQVGNNPEAVEMLTSALNMESASFSTVPQISRAEALRHRGDAFFQLNELPAAARDYEEAIALDPRNQGAIVGRAFVYGSEENWSAYAQTLSQALALNPENGGLLLLRGSAYVKNQQYTEALQDFDAALQVDPAYGAVYTMRGLAHTMLDLHEAARDDYLAAHRLGAFNPCTYQNLGLAYYHLDDDQSALASFDQATALDPNYSYPYVGRSMLHYRGKDYGEALAQLNRALQLNPQDDIAYEWRSYVYRALGNTAAASADAMRAQEIRRVHE